MHFFCYFAIHTFCNNINPDRVKNIMYLLLFLYYQSIHPVVMTHTITYYSRSTCTVWGNTIRVLQHMNIITNTFHLMEKIIMAHLN